MHMRVDRDAFPSFLALSTTELHNKFILQQLAVQHCLTVNAVARHQQHRSERLFTEECHS